MFDSPGEGHRSMEREAHMQQKKKSLEMLLPQTIQLATVLVSAFGSETSQISSGSSLLCFYNK